MPSPPERPLALLRELAVAPRPTGGTTIAAARARVSDALRESGFLVREHPFEFSEFPGRFATPLFGGVALFIVGAAGHLGSAGVRFTPLLMTAIGAAVLLSAGVWLSRRGVLLTPLLRARGTNLIATRPQGAPRIWLCAHLDTKSQPVPTLVRATGIVLTATGYVATLVLSLLAAAGSSAHRFWWVAAALVTLVGAVPVVLSMVGSRSPGALDNASGVAAVLEAARLLDGRDVGVLITDAEELGLAGARAWSRDANAAATAIVLNCDGVDDAGRNVVMYSGRKPLSLVDAVERAATASSVGVGARRMLPGLLTDSVAFADAGLSTLTFSRGSVASLARVHSPSDDLAHLRGTGIAQVGALMAATVDELEGGRS